MVGAHLKSRQVITGLNGLNKRDNGRSCCPSIRGEGVSRAAEPLEANTERNKLPGEKEAD